MKIILLLFFIICHVAASGQTNTDKISEIRDSVNAILSKQDKKIQQLSADIQTLRENSSKLDEISLSLKKSTDSLKTEYESLKKAQAAYRTAISGKIKETNNTLVSTQSIVKNRTRWGGIVTAIVLFALLTISYCLTKRIKSGLSSIDEIRKAQDALQTAQSKMQEYSVKLDNQMLTIIERQMKAPPMVPTDHSLALKVADEIVRIELNLSRMDASVKGYKQLSKAVERIKNNFQANGYEIVDMLGKPYSEGMRVVANFVPDETLKEGERIISGVTKPQINYNGEMIQSAQITVSQNI